MSAAANVFVGMVEAPLFVRPYLARVSRGELFAIMAGGMASIAGTVLFLYGSILRPRGARRGGAPPHRLDPFRARGAGDLFPDGAARACDRRAGGRAESEASGSMDALTHGTLEGAQLLLNIVAMLVVFVALVALVNLIIAPYTPAGHARLGARAARLAVRACRGARRGPPARCSAPRP